MLRLDQSSSERAIKHIGRPRELAKRETINALNDYLPHIHDLFESLRNAEPSQVDAVFNAALERLDAEHGPAIALMRANLMTHMAGTLFVYDIEAGDKIRKLNHTPGDTFLRLPFGDAIQHFLDRGILTFAEFEALAEEEKSRAFTVKRASSRALLERIKSHLDESMQPGGPGLREFIQDFESTATERLTPAYLENLYRTASSTSYQAGRLQGMTSEPVLAVFPYWEYVTVGDDRVRDSHAELDGKVWRANDPEALAHYPPNGYQCRCAILTREEDEVSSHQKAITVPPDAIQDGFYGAPTGRITEEATAI